MGQPSAKTFGGTPNSPLGTDFTNFLMHGLSSGSFGGNGVDQAQGFAGGVNHLLAGNPTDTASLMKGGFNLGNSPSFGTITGMGSNVPSMPGYSGPTNFNLKPFDANDPFAQSIRQALMNQQTQGLAQVNAQFSGGNAGSNSNAQGYANAMYMANAMPNLTNALAQQNYQQQGLDLQSLGLGANTGLGVMGNQVQGRGQDINALMQSLGYGVQNQGQQQQYNLGLGNLGLGSQSLAQQGQQNILSQLFGQYGNMTAMATPQAQTFFNPSNFSQLMSALASGAGSYASIQQGRHA